MTGPARSSASPSSLPSPLSSASEASSPSMSRSRSRSRSPSVSPAHRQRPPGSPWAGPLMVVVGLVAVVGLRIGRRGESRIFPPPSAVGPGAGVGVSSTIADPPALSPTLSPAPPDPVVAVSEAPPTSVEPPASVDAPDAEAAREAAAADRDLERAGQRLQDARSEARSEALRAAAATLRRQALPATIRDPSHRVAHAMARGAVLKAQADALKAVGTSLANVPRPRPKPLVDKSPVAQPTDGQEAHFEARRGRVSVIDLDRLMDRVAADAKVRLRVGGPAIRRIGGTVGPVGPFSLQYEMVRDGDLLNELFDAGGVRFSLTGWELVPVSSLRGESFEAALSPASEFSRAINRLRPGRTTITIWVYPDGFTLFRQLRDLLHQRGFLVAARPLPAEIPIRGSPAGSMSAGQ